MLSVDDSAVTCKHDVLTQPVNTAVPPVASLIHRHGSSSRELRQTDQPVWNGPSYSAPQQSSSLRLAAKDLRRGALL